MPKYPTAPESVTISDLQKTLSDPRVLTRTMAWLQPSFLPRRLRADGTSLRIALSETRIPIATRFSFDARPPSGYTSGP